MESSTHPVQKSSVEFHRSSGLGASGRRKDTWSNRPPYHDSLEMRFSLSFSERLIVLEPIMILCAVKRSLWARIPVTVLLSQVIRTHWNNLRTMGDLISPQYIFGIFGVCKVVQLFLKVNHNKQEYQVERVRQNSVLLTRCHEGDEKQIEYVL